MEISRVIDLARRSDAGGSTVVFGPRSLESSTLPLAEIPVTRLTGRALVIDLVSFGTDDRIRFADVSAACDSARAGDIAVFRTVSGGVGRTMRIEPEVIAALIVRGVLGFVTDGESLDTEPDMPLSVMIAAASGIVCVNLNNLDELSQATTIIEIIPDSTSTDSGPTRVMAFELG